MHRLVAPPDPAPAVEDSSTREMLAGSSSQPRDIASVRIFRAVALGHFGIDVFNSMGPVLLAFLKAPLHLTAGQVGLTVGIHQFLAGTTQPLFGWLADRIGSRILGPGSVAWTIGWLCLALVAAQRFGFGVFLLCFGLAAVGSGAFHPQGTMHAGAAIPGRAATTTSIFFLCGQVGLATGPAMAGVLLDRLGLQGILVLGAVFAPLPFYMFVAMGSRRWNPPPRSAPRPRAETQRPAGASLRLGVVSLLTLVFAMRGWVFIGTAAFLPLLFQLKGWSATRQGLLVGCFWMGGGITGVLAGGLADRWGRRRVVSVTTLLGALLLPLLTLADGPGAFVLALLCGGFLGAPHSVLMVMAQDLLPVKRGLGSGLALGFLFATGAVASWVIGMLADHFELAKVIQSGAVLGLLVALLSLLLPTSLAPPSSAADEATDEAGPWGQLDG